MLSGLPQSLTTWGLLVLSLRLIRIDGRELDERIFRNQPPLRPWSRRQRRHSKQSISDTNRFRLDFNTVCILIRLLISFAALFLAFPTFSGKAGSLLIGALLLDPLFGAPSRQEEKRSLFRKGCRLLDDTGLASEVLSRASHISDTEMVLSRSRKSVRRLSQDLKRAFGVEHDESPEDQAQSVTRVLRAPFRELELSERSTIQLTDDERRNSTWSQSRSSTSSAISNPPFRPSFDGYMSETLQTPPRPQSRLSHHAPVAEFSSLFPSPSSGSSSSISPLDTTSPLCPSPLFSPSSSPPDRLARSTSPPTRAQSSSHVSLELLELRVDDWVQLADGREGIIRFLGSRAGTATEWIGIEVIPNIAVNGAMYADWGPQADAPAVWVRPSGVQRILHRPMIMEVGILQFKEDIWDKPQESEKDTNEETRSMGLGLGIAMKGSEKERPSWSRRASAQTMWTLGTISEDEEEDSQKEQESDDDDDEDETIAEEHSPITDPEIYADTESETYVNESPTRDRGDRQALQCVRRTSSGNLRFEFDADSFSRTTSQIEQEEHGEEDLLGDVGETDDFEARMQLLVNGLDDILSGMGDIELEETEGRKAAEFAYNYEYEYECLQVPQRNGKRWSAPPSTGDMDAAEAPVVRDADARSGSVGHGTGLELERSLSQNVRRKWQEWRRSPGVGRKHIGWASVDSSGEIH